MTAGEVIHAPVDAACWVLRPPGHSRWAFDILPLASDSGAVAAGGWWRYLTGRLRSRDLSGWDAPVRAPLDGEVHAAHDGEPDRDRLIPWLDIPAGLLLRPLLRGRRLPAMAGNHVVIGRDGLFVLLAHLRHGSVAVRPGQRVQAGDTVGAVGASGNAVGPHLHLQAMDAADPLSGRPAPFALRRYRLWDGRAWHDRADSPLPAKRARVRFG